MPIVINGSGSITGISAGGLPDGCVTADDLASGVGGKILQVVSTTKTSTVNRNSATYADISGMSVSLTPQSGSKVYVNIDLQFGGQNNSYGGFKLLRGSTVIGSGTEGTGNMSNVTFGAGTGQDNDQYIVRTVYYSILDTHGANGSTSVTYKLQWASVYQNYYIFSTWFFF